jgi:diguanylate cyclase (GGDEF)-like protein
MDDGTQTAATPGDRGTGRGRTAWLLLAALAGFTAMAWWGPLASEQRWALYCVAETVAIVLAWGLSIRQRAPIAWLVLLAGFSLNVLADLLYYRETVIIGMGAKAALSDAVYVIAYVPMLAGLAMLGRRVGRDHGALLDASIFAVGLALPAIAFYLVPASREASIGLDGMLLLGWYALGSILVFAMYVRQLSARRSQNPAYLLLGAALLMPALGDNLWNLHALGSTPLFDDFPKVLWFLNRSLPLVVIAHPSVRQLWQDETAPMTGTTPLPRMRLAALTLGSLMPAITLLLSRFAPADYPYWIAIAGGGLLLPVMVLLRMDGLLQQLRAQARQLDMLSRSDELTGAPNRREWNRALAEAAAHARAARTSLALAVLDLDHFKAFNDAHGHHAGDTLLREAYDAWSALLPEGCLLARYGGEEFSLLMPNATASQAAQLLERMQPATPRGQTFSAGVSTCAVDAELANALDQADMALYEAKQAGRHRIRIATPA